MTRKLLTLVGFVLLALVVILIMKSKDRLRRAAETQNPAIVTQGGNLKVISPDSYAKALVVVPLSKTNRNISTNAPR